MCVGGGSFSTEIIFTLFQRLHTVWGGAIQGGSRSSSVSITDLSGSEPLSSIVRIRVM